MQVHLQRMGFAPTLFVNLVTVRHVLNPYGVGRSTPKYYLAAQCSNAAARPGPRHVRAFRMRAGSFLSNNGSEEDMAQHHLINTTSPNSYPKKDLTYPKIEMPQL